MTSSRSGRRLGAARAAAAVALGAAGALAAAGAGAADGVGTWADPHRVDAFPYAHGSDTTTGVEEVDRYGCASDLDESGPEVVYALELDRPGRLTAWVEGDLEGSVDLDVHIVASGPVGTGTADCVARGNRVAEADLGAGRWLVSVDTFVTGGLALTGPFVLRLDFLGEGEVRERTVARGVSWRLEVHGDLFGGPQTVNVLEVDLGAPGLTVAPGLGLGCETTSAIGERLGAVAGVNAGFFGPGCSPVGLVRVDDVFVASNPYDRPPRSTLGLGDGLALVTPVAPGDPFDAVRHALGGLPGLVRDGAAEVTWREEAAGESFSTARHPRTAACLTSDDRLMLVTFDGRTPAGLGVDLYDLADYLVSLGCDRGLNYDGGGSTAMWVASPAGYGVVSYPSDNRLADHRGERAVSNGWFVFAEPVNRPPRFTSRPPLEGADAEPWTYDADALDLDLDPIDFVLVSGPDGMAIDRVTGLASWLPGYWQGGRQRVVLGADDGSEVTEQAFEVEVRVADRDGDGLPDGWEERFGTDPDRPDADEDPDGDGLTNAEELARGSDPFDPNDPGGGVDGDADADSDRDRDAEDGAPVEGGCSCRTAPARPLRPLALLP